MGNYNLMRAKIKEKLEAVASVGEVNMYERTGFKEWPAVNVTVSGNEAEPFSVMSHMRTYQFTARVFLDYEGNPLDAGETSSKEQTETYLGDVVDDIIDAFDTDPTLGGTADIVRAMPSKWGFVEVSGGWARTADINIQVSKLISAN